MLPPIGTMPKPSRPLMDGNDAWRTIYYLILFVVFAFSTACPNDVGAADDPKVIYLEAGAVAPFSGDLFPPTLSVRLGLELQACEDRSAQKLVHVRRLFTIDLSAAQSEAAVKHEADQDRIKALGRELDLARAWYTSPAFVAAVTLVLTVTAGGVMGLIWGQVTP